MRQFGRICLFTLYLLSEGANRLDAQTEIDFIEGFALAEDRRVVIADLIPGTEDYFYYSCLHHQNNKQLADAAAVLEKWGAMAPHDARLSQMRLRQVILSYDANPAEATAAIASELGLMLNHQPPSLDVSAEFPSELDASKIATQTIIEKTVQRDGLQKLTQAGLWHLIGTELPLEQTRSLIGKLRRSDLEGLVEIIAEELSAKDSKGFGWARVHGMLTADQLDALANQLPGVWQQAEFVQEYLARQLPSVGELSEPLVLRDYLTRMEAITRKLPPSQANVRALVLGNLLKLNLAEGIYDERLFKDYLAIPRRADYYIRARNQPVNLADLSFSISPAVPLSPVGNDEELVRRHLMNFLRGADNVNAFASWIDRRYLEHLFAETKILAGVGDAATWFAKLPAEKQKALKDRVELSFAPDNDSAYGVGDAVKLKVELKNVPELTIRVYELSLKNFYRRGSKPLSTDIDLDGMIPAIEQRLIYDYAAERKHVEELPLPQLSGRGAWVIDLLGAGIRSRAVIQKGRLVATTRTSDAGMIVQVRGGDGAVVRDASVELQGVSYLADARGDIILPFAKEPVTRELLLIDGEFATRQTILHEAEAYTLSGSFLISRQSLVGGNLASALIATRLRIGDRPASIELLEAPKLEIVATDLDGTTSTQTVGDLKLSDAADFAHEFSVPMRLASLSLQLSGRIKRVSDGAYETVSIRHFVECNGMLKTDQVGAPYLKQRPDGYEIQLRGRNGERLRSRRLTVSLTSKYVTEPVRFEMATDSTGVVNLGSLEGMRSLCVSGDQIPDAEFVINEPTLNNQRQLHVPAGQEFTVGRASELQLPAANHAQHSLWSIVGRQKRVEELSELLSIEAGQIKCAGLPAGNYLYQNHDSGLALSILSVEGGVDDAGEGHQVIVGSRAIVQLQGGSRPVIADVDVGENGLAIQVAGAEMGARVHVIGKPFRSVSREGVIQWPVRNPDLTRLPVARCQFLNSLRLDEEYDYILKRRGAKKYPGVMLPDPTLLLHPWDIAESENTRRDARAGDPLAANKMRAEPSDSPMAPEFERGGRGGSLSASFEFLATPAVTLFNLEIVDGKVSVPSEVLQGCSHVVVHVVTPDGADTAEIALDSEDLQTRDMRLAQSLDPAKTLSQVRRVQILAPGESLSFDRSESPRLQTYSTLGGLFQFYGSVLADERWENFRFVTRWHQLDRDEKMKKYSEYSCHELNVFIYFKDRDFFDEVVRPFLQQKLSKQFVDHFLLGHDLSGFRELSALRKLNAAELVLLARRDDSVRNMVLDRLRRSVEVAPVDLRLRRQYFDAGLMGTALDRAVFFEDGIEEDASSASEMNFAVPEAPAGGGGFGGGGGGRASRGRSLGRVDTRQKLFGLERLSRKAGPGLFQELSTTRRWVETNYFRTRISDQNSGFIGVSEFWAEYLDQPEMTFIPSNIELPVGNFAEALIALALIDLPEESQGVKYSSDQQGVSLTALAPTIVMLEAIRETKGDSGSEPAQRVFIGQEVFSGDDPENPVDLKRCAVGKPYTAKVVVSNPTNKKRQIELLHQCPAGAIPLRGARSTESQVVDLDAFSTYQTEFQFYFPVAGEFQLYGAQVSEKGMALAAAAAQSVVAFEQVPQGDSKSWEYIANWASTDDVVETLKTANLNKLNLDRIAFRMSAPEPFLAITKVLADRGFYSQTLWAYACKHNDRDRFRELLANAEGLHAKLGPAFDSPVLSTNQVRRHEYEHVEFRPLVLARIHQLGAKRVILNSDLEKQYSQLLNRLAYQSQLSSSDRLQVVYYLLLQNRIEEAVEQFASVKKDNIEALLQFDYLQAYLSLATGEYPTAKAIAERYQDYPVEQWKANFNAVLSQLAARDAMLAGSKAVGADESVTDATMRRDAINESGAATAATLAMKADGGKLLLESSNLDELNVNFYVMDVELLFSRRPFVGLKGQQLPAIAPNATLAVDPSQPGTQTLMPPAPLANKNLIVEATGGGLSRTAVVTPSGLACEVAESFGQVRVRAAATAAPVEAAYVKVYAKLRGGETRFYKDGYTDLRGYFDYATLSTNDLDSVERFAILVLDEELGAEIREATPPAK